MRYLLQNSILVFLFPIFFDHSSFKERKLANSINYKTQVPASDKSNRLLEFMGGSNHLCNVNCILESSICNLADAMIAGGFLSVLSGMEKFHCLAKVMLTWGQIAIV